MWKEIYRVQLHGQLLLGKKQGDLQEEEKCHTEAERFEGKSKGGSDLQSWRESLCKCEGLL